jgi:hypothetical protein
MPTNLRTRRPHRRLRARGHVRPRLEALEERSLPATTWPGLVAPLQVTGGNDTATQAVDLGTLDSTGRAEVVGTVANAAGGGGVGWYRFTLAQPAQVSLATLDRLGGSPLVSVLGLYDSDPQDFADPFNPTGYRLLAQDDGAAHQGDASLTRTLSPGTYYVAVSGDGDNFFSPVLADSGYPGSTGDYGLLLTATDLALAPGAGPAVLGSDPAPGSAVTGSPFVIRLNVSAPLDPNTIIPGGNVSLTYNPTGTFGDGNDQDVPLVSVNFTPAADELQLIPAAPLAPGFYRVFLAGDQSGSVPVVAGLDGTPLGQDNAHPAGADFTLTFQVAGVEGVTTPNAGSNDTPATAHDLGNLAGAGIVHVAGAIGDDPAYNPASSNPNLANPAAEVDLYHFQITGPGNFSLGAEVFAGRIGSPLDPALSLFKRAPDGSLTLVTVNDNSLNATAATDGSMPLFTDPVLYAGLTAGDYYLAVSGTGNMPDPSQGLDPGTQGVFDPSVTDSGTNGFTVGPYVLNLLVQADSVPPQVTATTPADGAALAAPPTQLTVRFSEPVNLQQLTYETYQQSTQTELAAVYVQAADGTQYHPRLVSYDANTNEATFLMLDGLANGPYELHLSGAGPLGVADLAGNPLVGNDPSGDYVVHFTVTGPARGTNGNPLLWTGQGPNDTLAQAQVLGVLFPHELQAGVVIQRLKSPSADTADYYQFQVLQQREYIFALNGYKPPSGPPVTITDANGNPIAVLVQGNGSGVKVNLAPGTYVVRVGGWTPAQAPEVAYQLRIGLALNLENPPPLTVGPAPALRLTLATNPTPTPTPTPGQPPASVPVVGPTTTFVVVASPSTGGRAAGASGPTLALPAGALTGLSAAPVGGVRSSDVPGAPSGPDRLLLGAELYADNPIPLPVGDAVASGGGDEPTGAGPLAPQEIRRALEQYWDEILDAPVLDAWLKAWLGYWLDGWTLPGPAPEPAAEGAAPDTNLLENSCGWLPSDPAPAEAGDGPTVDWRWACAAAAVAAWAADRPPKRRADRPGRPVPTP